VSVGKQWTQNAELAPGAAAADRSDIAQLADRQMKSLVYWQRRTSSQLRPLLHQLLLQLSFASVYIYLQDGLDLAGSTVAKTFMLRCCSMPPSYVASFVHTC